MSFMTIGKRCREAYIYASGRQHPANENVQLSRASPCRFLETLMLWDAVTGPDAET